MGSKDTSETPGFSVRLRDLRLARGLRQKDLAQALGMAQTTIANYEQNTRFPDEVTLRRLAEYFGVSFDELLGRVREPVAAVSSREPTALGALGRRYLDLVLAGDEAGAMDLLRRELAAGMDSRRIYLEVVQPCLYEVGRLWETGRIDVAEEHRISHIVERLMGELRSDTVPKRGAPGRRFAAITVHGDTHHLGARMVSDFLEMDGWRATYLGGNLSIRHSLQALEGDPPDLLLLSATVAQAASSVADLISALRARENLRGMRILVGGQLFNQNPDLWREMGADATAADALQAVEVANRLVPAAPTAGPGSAADP